MRTVVAPRRQHWWLTLIAACLVLAACHRSAPVNGEDPGWVERSDTRHKIAVVFVHGIFGSTRGTWTDAHGESFFRLLKNDATLGPQVDTYAFGFSSNIMTGGSLDIREAANKLQSYLQPSGVLDYPAIVFVGHSMGGLVIMRYLANNLDKAPALAEKVPLIVLFSAPMEGAQVAQLAALVASNPALSNLRPVDSNDMLKQLSDDWASLAAKPRVSCAYETADVGGVRIVQWGSATRVCDGRPVAIDNADHISLVKPDRATHPAYMFLSGQLTEHVLPLQMSAQLELPDFQRDENSYIFTLGTPEENARLMNTGRARMKYWIGEKSSRSLLVSPGASPQLINGNSTELLTVALRVDADENAYEFTLKSDLPSEQTVRVLVPDLSRLRTGHQRNAIKVTTGLAQYLGDPANAEKIAASQHDPDQLNAQLAAVAHAALGEPIKRLPSAEQWLLTADLLAAANLRSIASAALAQSAGIDAFYLQTEKELRGKLLAQGRAELLLRSAAVDGLREPSPDGDPDKPHSAGQAELVSLMPAIPEWLDTVAYRDSSLQLVRNMEKVASLRQDAATLEVATVKMPVDAARDVILRAERERFPHLPAAQWRNFESPAAKAERRRPSLPELDPREKAKKMEKLEPRTSPGNSPLSR